MIEWNGANVKMDLNTAKFMDQKIAPTFELPLHTTTQLRKALTRATARMGNKVTLRVTKKSITVKPLFCSAQKVKFKLPLRVEIITFQMCRVRYPMFWRECI